jgi:hypothetical protein
LDAADEIERRVQRFVILWIRRDVGLRAGLLVAFGLEVSAQRSLTARVGARFELLGDLFPVYVSPASPKIARSAACPLSVSA